MFPSCENQPISISELCFIESEMIPVRKLVIHKRKYNSSCLDWNKLPGLIFLSLIGLLFLLWYLSLLLFVWRKDNINQKQVFFENDAGYDFSGKELSLLKVSAGDFTSQLKAPVSEEKLSLVFSFYEETGMDEGYELDYFLGGHDASPFFHSEPGTM